MNRQGDLRNRALDALMQQLRQAMATSPSPLSAPADCQPVDWAVPHRLNSIARQQVQLLADRIAFELTGMIATLTARTVDLSGAAICEHYAGMRAEQIERTKPPTYFLPLAAAGSKTATAFWEIELPCAASLVSAVLGDPQPKALSEPLSSLSEAILSDTLTTLSDGLSRALVGAGLARLEVLGTLTYAAWPIKLDGLYELCSFSFRAKSENIELVLGLTVPMELLAPVAGLTAPFGPAAEKKDFSERIVRRLHESPTPVEAHVGGGVMTVGQMFDLQVGDVVVLDRKISEPMDVLVHGQMCFTAWPAAVGQKLALVFCDVKTRL